MFDTPANLRAFRDEMKATPPGPDRNYALKEAQENLRLRRALDLKTQQNLQKK